jgi:hypothetical protein
MSEGVKPSLESAERRVFLALVETPYWTGGGVGAVHHAGVLGAVTRAVGDVPARAPALAWHIRAVLGDALWRSQAGVPLPGGGTVDGWVEEMRERIAALAAWRPFDAPR